MVDAPNKVKQVTAGPDKVNQKVFGQDKVEQAAVGHEQGWTGSGRPDKGAGGLPLALEGYQARISMWGHNIFDVVGSI